MHGPGSQPPSCLPVLFGPMHSLLCLQVSSYFLAPGDFHTFTLSHDIYFKFLFSTSMYLQLRRDSSLVQITMLLEF